MMSDPSNLRRAARTEVKIMTYSANRFASKTLPFATLMLAAGLTALCFGIAPVSAQDAGASDETFETGMVQTPTIVSGSVDQVKARRIRISTGRSIMVNLPRSAKEVFVGNPAIANAVIRTSRKMYIIAVAEGTTTIFVNDGNGRQIAAFDVNVAKERGNEIEALREVLRATLPHADISAKSVGENIVLSGEVDSLLEAQRAVDIASNLVGVGIVGGGTLAQAAGGTNGGGVGSVPTVTGKVINGLRVRGKDQVMLKVTVAEVKRNVLKQLGVQVNGSWNVGGSTFGIAPTNPWINSIAAGPQVAGNISQPATGSINAISGQQSNLFGSAFSGNTLSIGQIKALETQGAFKTLAEPTLTAISGESARFLAGGEIPIPTENCDAARCTTSVEFKNVGVSLAFTPVVLSEGKISMRVSTEVTERDDANSVRTGPNTFAPGFVTRKTETTVELPSGGSMVTAGLIQNNSATTVSGFPGLMNLPVLGALFRSRDYRRNETELMIMVTPFIVRPVATGDIPKPTDGFVDASDPAGLFLGRVNRVYGGKDNRPGEGFKAPVGFIAD
jgi:pilus assembly protein CpaC